MNERIRDLAEQCQHRYSEHNIDLEKFAELIVQDCVSQIAMIAVTNFECPDVTWTAERAIEVIQERYGVTHEQ